MSDEHQQLLMTLAEIRKLIDRATLGPWYALESTDHWSLHGEAREFKGKTKDGIGPSMQILKAPKHGTPYAEYWPNLADGTLLVKAVNVLPFWLDWAEDVAKRHFPTPCSCGLNHFLCAEHRAYEWSQCPEMKGLIRSIKRMHISGDDG